MSGDLPFNMGGFFPGMLNDLMGLMRTEGPLQWDLARQLAVSIANPSGSQQNVDPLERIAFEQIAKVAELHVADITGMATTPSGRPAAIVALTPGEWADRSLTAWRRPIEAIATALLPEHEANIEPTPEGEETDLQALLSRWANLIAPAMTAMQVGSVIGRLAKRTIGQYELLLPREDPSEILVIPEHFTRFAEDWSVSKQDLILYLTIRDVATHALLSRPHVAERMIELLSAHARGFTTDLASLEERLSSAAPGDVNDLARLFSDPMALGEATESPEHQQARLELQTLGSAILGYVEWVTDAAARRTVSSAPVIREALRRRRMSRSDDERAADALFGLSLDQETFDRGETFVRGVLERNGEHELARLWTTERYLPTPAEIDAPGLWLERINLPID